MTREEVAVINEEIAQTFAPPGAAWERVSPKLAKARRITLLVCLVPLLIVAGVLLVIVAVTVWVSVAFTGAAAVGIGWLWWYIGRRAQSWGYAERAQDLLVTSGFMFRRLVIVPYGRMQLVDLAAGPIDRWLGIVTLQLHTAAATTDAKIPGLPPDVAAALRDRLAERGEQRSAGL